MLAMEDRRENEESGGFGMMIHRGLGNVACHSDEAIQP